MVAALRRTARATERRREAIAARSALLRLNPMTVKNSQKEAFSKLMAEKNAEAKRLSKSIRNVFESERESLAREDALMISLGKTAEAVAAVAEAFGGDIALPADFPENLAAVRNFSNDVERGAVKQGDVSGLRDYADYLSFQAEEVLSRRPGIVAAGRANSGETRALRNAVAKLEREKKELEKKLKTRGDWLRLHRRERRRLVTRVANARGKSAMRSGNSNENDLERAMRDLYLGSTTKKRIEKRARSSGPISMEWSETRKRRA
jgi:hypothetical protein